ncbi:MAG: SMC family ATPase, partial [Sporichthyaceae bacterium]|nr:SMC family ATPase [Sporichthyaceae bacterium]
AVARAGATRARVGSLERLSGSLDDLLAERAPLAAQHRTVDHLSRLAEGKSADNRLRMSLSGYVLAARLEQVATCASQRLLRMSSGRFSLLHSATAARGRGRGGLHLRVLDSWTGQERDPATLSGGEAFSASLALALGLAEVVTAEAGGTLLETLFVDEGFGSLDDDTLDDVMSVLDDLREGGRTVGIVSHVADLRQRIPAQVRVSKGRHGSVIDT